MQTLCMTGLVSCLDWTAEAKRAATLVIKNAVQSEPQAARDSEEGQPW